MKIINLKGRNFGRLKVLSFSHSDGRKYWNCVCECGSRVIVKSAYLVSGDTKSCGCLALGRFKEMIEKHGMTGTKTYRAWKSMRSRCYNAQNNKYHIYGGRGIKICEKWESFVNFYKDMGACPDGKTLDRINTNKDYSPLNCRWATQSIQQNNRRNNRRVEVNGILHTLAEWSRINNISKDAIYARIHRGWDEKRAVTMPSKYQRSQYAT